MLTNPNLHVIFWCSDGPTVEFRRTSAYLIRVALFEDWLIVYAFYGVILSYLRVQNLGLIVLLSVLCLLDRRWSVSVNSHIELYFRILKHPPDTSLTHKRQIIHNSESMQSCHLSDTLQY